MDKKTILLKVLALNAILLSSMLWAQDAPVQDNVLRAPLPMDDKPIGWRIDFGGGVRGGRDAWAGSNHFVQPTPALSVRYGKWRLSGAGFRYIWKREDTWDVSLGLQYREDGYNPSGLLAGSDSDAEVFEGYQEPDGEVVFSIRGRWHWVGYQVAQDVSNQSRGTRVSLRSGAPLWREGKHLLGVDVGLEWQSSNYTLYYFGIDQNQANDAVGRFQYSPGSAINYSAGINYVYKLSPKWRIGAGLSFGFVAGNVTDSPLIEEDMTYRWFAGARYSYL